MADFYSLETDELYVWSAEDPDVELVEGEMCVSINKNYLVFGRKDNRPPQKHTIEVTNYGDRPVAYKVMTSDNTNYFVNTKCGIIPGRQTGGLPEVRGPNWIDLVVYRRPCFCSPDHKGVYEMAKDQLQILVAPALSWTVPPAGHFHWSQPYSVLRAELVYTGHALNPVKDTSRLKRRSHYWNTWEAEMRAQRKELPPSKPSAESAMAKEKTCQD